MTSARPISTNAPPEPLGMAAVLSIPVMRRLWYAQIVSVFGDFVALFAVISILTFRLQGTPRQITGVQIAAMLPIAVLGILAGVFVDRWPLKPTMVGSDVLRAMLVLALLVSTRPWHFYAVLAGISVVSSFFGPAQGVAIRAAVPLHGLRSANALIQQVMFGMRIIGPAAAAFLVATVGPVSCYLLDAASFVASAALIASTALVRPEAAAPAQAAEHTGLRRIWIDMKQGIGFIVHHARAALHHPRARLRNVRHRLLRSADRRLRPRQRPRLHPLLRRIERHDRPRHDGGRQRPQSGR